MSVAVAGRVHALQGPLRPVLYDARFPASVAFGEAVRRSGAPVRAIEGDVTSLWLDDLERHFARGGAAVAGLGTSRTLLCLIELARGPGVRVVWRGEHWPSGDGGMRHALEGPAGLVAQVEASLARGQDWPAAMAGALLAAEGAGSGRAAAVVHGPAREDFGEAGLASWILAPRRMRES